MEFGIVMSSELGNDWTAQAHLKPGSWQARHYAALVAPTAVEKPFVEVLSALVELVARHGDDYVLREGVAHLLLGMADLLNADIGALEAGSVSTSLVKLADRIHFDMEMEQFTDEDQA
jgi:hypothetical protein